MTITAHSSMLPTQEAIYAALIASSSFTSVCKGIFDPAPLNQTFPYAAFGEHDERPWYQFQKPGKQLDFIIHVYSQQPTFAEAMNIIDVITNVIEAQTLNILGGNFTNAQNGVIFVSARKVPEPDGITRHLEGRWHIWNNAN